MKKSLRIFSPGFPEADPLSDVELSRLTEITRQTYRDVSLQLVYPQVRYRLLAFQSSLNYPWPGKPFCFLELDITREPGMPPYGIVTHCWIAAPHPAVNQMRAVFGQLMDLCSEPSLALRFVHIALSPFQVRKIGGQQILQFFKFERIANENRATIGCTMFRRLVKPLDTIRLR